MNKIPNYRVWHKIEKRFVDLRSIDFELENIGYDCQGEANYYDVAKFDEIVFQQWTGLKDSEGKDIYEGDRIEFYSKDRKTYYFGEIRFTDGSFLVKIVGHEGTLQWLWMYHLNDYEQIRVIGNTFQLPCNPDHNGECLVCDCWLSDCPFNKENKE